MAGHLSRITINPQQCGGRPCIRGMRIRVTDVLDLLAAGLSSEQVLEELPELEPNDITAALQFASRKLDQAVLATSYRSALAAVPDADPDERDRIG
jgi:uncharacterized protein (DUF433 family)